MKDPKEKNVDHQDTASDDETQDPECPIHVGKHTLPCTRCLKNDYLSEADSIRYIVKTMRRFPNNVQVQEQPCKALGVQAWDDNSRTEIANERNGVDAIVQTMQTHGEDREVQQNGCGVWANLSASRQNRNIIADQGCIEAIIKAMQTFQQDRDV